MEKRIAERHLTKWLEKEGFRLTTLDVNGEGFVDLDQLRKSIADKTFLVSVQHGNQEVGTIQPVGEIATICQERGVQGHDGGRGG